MSQSHVESPTPEAVESVSVQARRRWTGEEWSRLWRDLRDDTQQLLVVIAEQPGEWVPITALVRVLDSSRQVQSALSSFTKRAKKHGLPKWPFEAVTDLEAGHFRYRMDEKTAAIVLELARANRGD
jgi:hypothetical protein